MNQEMFRKAARDRLSSPGQLEDAIRVAAPRTWMALAAVLLVALAAGLWGVLGRLPTTVTGTGVLIRAGGVYSLVSTTSGRVQQMLVADDATVARDQVIAIVDQPELRARLRAGEEALARERADLAELVERRDRALRFDLEQRRRERASLDEQVRQATAELEFLRGELSINRDLESRGLVTRQTTIDIERRIEQCRAQAATLRGQIQQSAGAGQMARDRVTEDVAAARQRLADHERDLGLLRRQTDEGTRVRSFHAGRVVAVKVEAGAMVTVGTPMVSLEVPQNSLEAVLFVDAGRVKEVTAGMRVELTPSAIRREEYGFITGVVTRVSEYPATFEEEMRLLANEPLVRALQGDGADTQVNVRLDRDATTRSGFKWSSRTGPPVAIDSGTMCGAEIVTRSDPPIRLVFPAIRRTLGLD